MGTTAASVLDQKLSQLIGDWIEEDVTTAIAASTALISTNLNKWDNGNPDHFNNFWVYITEMNNIAVERKIYDYATSGGVCSVRGGNLTAEASTANFATCRFYRHPYTAKIRAINDAIREISSDILFREIDDRTLVTGNHLPDGSFEDWTTSTALRFYATHATYTVTLAKTTTAGLYRGQRGTTSSKVTATAIDGFLEINNLTYPRLLDLMGQTVSFYCWAYPEVADDVELEIYTSQAAGSTQTLTSTTSAPAGKWSLLKLENQKLNDDLEHISLRFRVETDTKYAYFDDAVLCGKELYEYLLPETLRDGDLSRVEIQTSGYADDVAAYDILPPTWDKIYNWDIASDGTYKYLRLHDLYSDHYRLRLTGTSPLSEVSAFDDTVEIDGREVDLLIAYAAYCLFRNEEGVPAADDTARYTKNQAKYLMEYERLRPSLKMIKPRSSMHITGI